MAFHTVKRKAKAVSAGETVFLGLNRDGGKYLARADRAFLTNLGIRDDVSGRVRRSEARSVVRFGQPETACPLLLMSEGVVRPDLGNTIRFSSVADVGSCMKWLSVPKVCSADIANSMEASVSLNVGFRDMNEATSFYLVTERSQSKISYGDIFALLTVEGMFLTEDLSLSVTPSYTFFLMPYAGGCGRYGRDYLELCDGPRCACKTDF